MRRLPTLLLLLALPRMVGATPASTAGPGTPSGPGPGTAATSTSRANGSAASTANGTATAQPAPAPSAAGPVREATAAEDVPVVIKRGIRTVHIHQLVEEMVDDLADDLRELDAGRVSPLAFQGLTLTPNLAGSFGVFVEGTIVSTLAATTPLQIKRCVACRALHTRTEGDQWVVRLGLVRQDDLVREAQRLNVQAFLRTALSWFPEGNVVTLQAEIVRASDGAVLWADTYRSDATTAAILRSGERMQTRAERVAELERKLAGRPYWGYRFWGGAASLPYDSPEGPIRGMSVGGGIYEKFGAEDRFLYGITVDGFLNLGAQPLVGAFVFGTVQWEILPPNLNDPVVRTGPALGGFLAGNEGNSGVVEWTLDATLIQRLGAGASLFYFIPVELSGRDLGGFGWKLRLTATW